MKGCVISNPTSVYLQVPIAGNVSETTNTLIPFWDMANHDNGEMSTDFDDDKDCTLCMAHRHFEVGQQFTIFYGVRANIDLLVHNGFVFESNQDDCLTLKLGISKNDALAADKVSFLEELNIPRNGLFFIKGLLPEASAQKPIDEALLGFLRVLCMTAADMDVYRGNIDQIKSLIDVNACHGELDKRVYNYLQTRCQLLLKSYPTSLQEDEELLKSKDLSQKQYFCCLLRSREKQMLNGAIKYCSNLSN